MPVRLTLLHLFCLLCTAQVADLQKALKEEQIIVEEKKAQTDELIVSIGREKATVDEAVEAGREDEEACSKLQSEVQAFQVRGLALTKCLLALHQAANHRLDHLSSLSVVSMCAGGVCPRSAGC